MWDDPNVLAKECNRVMAMLNDMPEEAREAWVRDVLLWFIGISNEMMEKVQEAQKKGLKGKLELVRLLKQLKQEYGKQIEERKPEIIVALTYAIKPEFQEVLAPFLYSSLGLV